uniref:Putative e3 ubiquitin-protein ligase traip n=1 Tax=Haematobia irritans TaxID=7368 RepID=A0A1L8E8Q0_HAEIR
MTNLNLRCSRCLEAFKDVDDICSTNCGHIFHYNCLSGYQKGSFSVCPKCKKFNVPNHKLHLDFENGKTENDIEYSVILEKSERENEDLKTCLHDKGIDMANIRFESEKEIFQLNVVIRELKVKIANLESMEKKMRQHVFALTNEITQQEEFSDSVVTALTKENDELKQDFDKIRTDLAVQKEENDHLKTILKSFSEEIEKMLHSNKELKNENEQLKDRYKSYEEKKAYQEELGPKESEVLSPNAAQCLDTSVANNISKGASGGACHQPMENELLITKIPINSLNYSLQNNVIYI